MSKTSGYNVEMNRVTIICMCLLLTSISICVQVYKKRLDYRVYN